MFYQSLISFPLKILTYKKGSSVIFSFAASMMSMSVFERLNNIFFKNAEMKDIYLPVLIEVVMVILYQAMTINDFYFGYRVAKKIRGESFDKDRALDTLAKSCAMVIMTSVLVFFAMVCASEEVVLDFWGLADISLSGAICIALSIFWFMAISFEFLSIGKNLELINGYKSGIFEFFEGFLNFVKAKFFDSLSNLSFKPNRNATKSNEIDISSTGIDSGPSLPDQKGNEGTE